jgi:hypothetical protein
MKNKTFLSNMAIAVFVVWGGLSCTTNFEDDTPLPILNSGVEIYQGTLKVTTFDHFEDLITGKEQIGSDLQFLSFQENFQELMNPGNNLRISQDGFNEINAWNGSVLLEILDEDGFVIIEEYLIYMYIRNCTSSQISYK